MSEYHEIATDLAMRMQACVDHDAHSSEHVRDAALTLYVQAALCSEDTDEQILQDVRMMLRNARRMRAAKAATP